MAEIPTVASMIDPSNQQLNAVRWTDKEPYASIPFLPTINNLIAGERKQIPPTEGVTAVQGMADPITNIAMLIAPFAKAALSHQQPLINPATKILSSQRGSVSGEAGNESTMDALKRMFIERGSSETKGYVPKLTAEEMKVEMNRFPKGEKVVPETTEYLDSAQLKTLPEQAGSVIRDFNNISKEWFKEDFTKRFGSINDRTVDKVWQRYQANGLISKEVNQQGLYTVNHPQLDIDALKSMFPKSQ